MAKLPSKIETWQMVALGKMKRATIDVPKLKTGEVLVEIAGCGICYNDHAVFYGEVPTGAVMPRTLGHEISGTIVDGDAKLVGKEVIIPPAMPCHNCLICKAGRENRCLAAKIPGYSMGIYGGNSSHIVVPSADLCYIKEKKEIPLSHFAVVADAVASTYQAAKRANVQPGDMVIIVGATGGAGVYATQVCAAMGAKEIIGIARNEEKLQRALKFGATHVISSQNKTAKEVHAEFYSYCMSKKLSPYYGWKIFEWSGTAAGQEIALELLPFIGKLVVAGCGTHKNEFSLSRLMTLEADIIGSWACRPKYYPDVLNMVLSGIIQIEPFIKTMPMSQIKEAYEEAHRGGLTQRIVLTPDFE
ncbi:MAG TPA: 6-hydroxycyclohex-1-ene-1-carbonyl-CoA dehydrogenase [Bacillota bacterium]|nr:6-hydroxycyclohex-1-ene-1-carbonyl-CoA dehydrogenase [Bacillota bacterium]